MFIEVFIVLALIALNGFFALAEMALVSAREARLQRLSAHRGAAAALRLKADPKRFLSTVQIGITLIGVIAGAFGGATLSGPVAHWFDAVPALAPYAETLAVGLVVVFITVMSLVFGELVPKQIALTDPETVAVRVARPMEALAILFTPAVAALGASSGAILRLFGIRRDPDLAAVEDELKLLIREGTESGVLHVAEKEMVTRVLRLDDRTVDTLMTPRPQMVWLDAEAPGEANLKVLAEHNFAVYPVMRGDAHTAEGFVRAKDLVAGAVRGERPDLARHLRPPVFVPETTSALSMLEKLQEETLDLAFVIDEYGDVQGILTPADILEAIVGEFAEMDEDEERSVVQREDGSYLVDGMLPVEEFKVLLDIETLPHEDDHDYNTVAGMLLALFERIPHAGEYVEWAGFRFEIMDMDRRRIDKILVTPPPDDSLAEAG